MLGDYRTPILGSVKQLQEIAAEDDRGLGSRLARRWEATLLGAFCLLFVVQAVASAWHKSPVADAPVHYDVGEAVLGKPTIPGSAPIWEGTMPVTVLNVLSSRLRTTLTPLLGEPDDRWEGAGVVIPSVLWARLPTVLFGALLLILTWSLARLHAGPTAGLCAAFLLAFQPEIIGHSRFITTDIPATAGILAGVLAISFYCVKPERSRFILAAVTVALVQIIKVTALILFPLGAVAVLLVVIRSSGSWKSAIGEAVIWGMMSFGLFLLIVNFAYSGFSPDRTRVEQEVFELEVLRPHREMLQPLAAIFPQPYVESLAMGRAHNANGHPAFLMGEHRLMGWFWYFPMAILLKTTIPLLALALGGWLLGAKILRRSWCLWILSGAYLLSFCLAVNVNIGLRYVLPVYPALAVSGGVCLGIVLRCLKYSSCKLKWLLIGIPLIVVVEAGTVFPHYAEYFNLIAGGKNNGWKYLGDSNIQWNQDEWIIRDWVDQQRVPVSVNPTSPVTGRVVVRADFLVGLTPEMAQAYTWLRENHRPSFNITPGVLVYEVELPPDDQNSEGD